MLMTASYAVPELANLQKQLLRIYSNAVNRKRKIAIFQLFGLLLFTFCISALLDPVHCHRKQNICQLKE